MNMPTPKQSWLRPLAAILAFLLVCLVLYQISLNQFFQNYWKNGDQGIVLFIGNSTVENVPLASWYFGSLAVLSVMAFAMTLFEIRPTLRPKTAAIIAGLSILGFFVLFFLTEFLPYLGAFFISLVTGVQRLLHLKLSFIEKNLVILINVFLWLAVIKIVHQRLSRRHPLS